MDNVEKLKLLDDYVTSILVADMEKRNLILAEQEWNGWESTYPKVAKQDYQDAAMKRDKLRKELEAILLTSTINPKKKNYPLHDITPHWKVVSIYQIGINSSAKNACYRYVISYLPDPKVVMRLTWYPWRHTSDGCKWELFTETVPPGKTDFTIRTPPWRKE